MNKWVLSLDLNSRRVEEFLRSDGIIIIIIMYTYHALINALSTHMIHINLNTIFYTHVEHLPKQFTQDIIWKHIHTHTHNDYSRNWVLILIGVEILWEEEAFQFDFKRRQDWAVSMVLWEWIPNVGSKARESHDSCVCIAGFSACGCLLHCLVLSVWIFAGFTCTILMMGVLCIYRD